jgi:hypothetical protein
LKIRKPEAGVIDLRAVVESKPDTPPPLRIKAYYNYEIFGFDKSC